MSITNALINLLSRLSLLIVIMYMILTLYNTRSLFIKLIKSHNAILLGILGAIFGIIGTYLGIWYKGAIINYRDVGVIFTSLIGGFPSAFIAGGIASAHRLFLGGISAIPCAIGTFLSGIIAASIHYLTHGNPSIITIFFTASFAETVHLAIARYMIFPESLAIDITHKIFIPMVVVNTFGVTLLATMFKNFEWQMQLVSKITTNWFISIFEELIGTINTKNSEQNISKICQIIAQNSPVDGVFVTSQNSIISKYPEDLNLEIDYKKSIKSKKILKFFKNGTWYIVFPITIGDDTAGTLIFFSKDKMKEVHIFFGKKIVHILSLVFSIQKAVIEAKLAKEAQLREFTSKLSPHFLFNTLSTVRYFSNVEPKKSVECIDKLSELLRYIYERKDKLTTLESEINAIENYLGIMKMRYPEILEYKINCPKIDVKIPPFIFQPVIENAIKYGRKNNKIKIEISCHINEDRIRIEIRDHGPGIDKITMGTGLKLVSERLKLIYNNQASLLFENSNGLKVIFDLPAR
ncbi:hypothetical protein XJ44_00515 [Thermosipho affectus]|uniref:Histidine kinase n=2 Tax=Thermosipho affectus TaxID=660294 RepID=A0ABX3ILN4_9BACT|nr:hypothetical protein XJ44_00515 [Thermosipho affectus]